ncbi:hypothetical protein ACP4OV_015087 [Aristida adscensionis]
MELGGAGDAGGSPNKPVVLCLFAPRGVDMEMEDAPEEPELLVGSGPDGIVVGSEAPPPAIVAAEAGGPSSQAPGVQIAAVGSSSFMLGAGHGEEGAAVAAGDAAAGIQMTATGSERFVPIRDVKGMLQSGRLEGMQIVYRTKRDKQNLLHGVIHGLSYFCACSDCDYMGKALSARAFQQHALGNGNESYNPNDQIIICASNISLFDACRRLKEATSEARLKTIFDNIINNGGPEVAMRKKTTSANNIFAEPSPSDSSNLDANLTEMVKKLGKRMESAEKSLEKVQVQVDTTDKSVDFLHKEMERHQRLFQDLSKVTGNLWDEM